MWSACSNTIRLAFTQSASVFSFSGSINGCGPICAGGISDGRHYRVSRRSIASQPKGRD
jgi:hypothetical protein